MMTEDEGRKLLRELIEREEEGGEDFSDVPDSDGVLDPDNMPIDDVIRELQRLGVDIEEFEEESE